MKNLNFLHPITTTLILFIFPICIHAQSRTWDGGEGTESWHDAANWHPDGIPTAEEVIELPEDIGIVRISHDAFAHALILRSGVQLIVNQNEQLRVDGATSDGIGINIYDGAMLQIAGEVTITGSEATNNAVANAGQMQITGRLSITGPTNFSGIYNVPTGSIDNRSTGQITISGTLNGIENSGSFLNQGSMMISNVSNRGIYNHNSTATLTNQGSIQIAQTGGQGIYNADESSFINNNDGLPFSPSSQLILNDIGGIGIDNSGASFTLTNDAVLEMGNTGAITFAAIGNFRFEGVESTFNNNGHIKIGEGASVGISNVITNNGGVFHNDYCGLIHIYSTNVANIHGSDRSAFNNDGVLITNGTPNNAALDNDNGIIYNLGSGTFPAETSGFISASLPPSIIWTGCAENISWADPDNWLFKERPTMDQAVLIRRQPRGGFLGTTFFPTLLFGTASIRSLRVDFSASLTIANGATLAINEGNHAGVTDGLEVQGTLTNQGELSIAHTTKIGIFLYETGSITNEGSAILRIDDVGGNAIYLEHSHKLLGGSLFDNEGSIHIGIEGAIGMHGIENNGSFRNGASGTIYLLNIEESGVNNISNSFSNYGLLQIDEVGGNGIQNSSTTSIFNNYGTLQIDRVGKNGIQNNAEFYNNIGLSGIGQIFILETGMANIVGETHGINNIGNFQNHSFMDISQVVGEGIINHDGGIFGNHAGGEIEIDRGGIQVEDVSDFYNFACGYINITSNDEITTNEIESSFRNEGILIENSDGNSNITYNAGIVYDLNGTGLTIADDIGITSTNGNELYWTACSRELVTGFAWNNPLNWSAHTLPTVTTSVIIPTDPMVVATLVKSKPKDAVASSKAGHPCDPIIGSSFGPIIGSSFGGGIGFESERVVQSLTIASDDAGLGGRICILPCSSLTIATAINNNGSMNIDGLLRIGTTYSGSGTVDIDNNTGFIYQAAQDPSTTLPACNVSPNRCFSVNPTDDQFSMDNDGDGVRLCEGDVDELNNLNPPVTVQLSVYLEGGLTFLLKDKTGEKKQGVGMSTSLTNLPTEQPFNQSPWNYNGSENVNDLGGMPDNITDWVLIEAYTELNNPVPIARKAALLRFDGSLVDPATENSGIPFPSLTNGSSYYITVRHRNHLAVMSSVPVLTNSHAINYDFSTGQGQVLGNEQLASIAEGIWALPAGDMNSDGIISVDDFNILQNQLGQSSGVFDADLDLDGVVEVDDFNLYQQNSSKIGVAIVRY